MRLNFLRKHSKNPIPATLFALCGKKPNFMRSVQRYTQAATRREELAELKWVDEVDLNFQWHGIALKDKIKGRRAGPLTPFVAHRQACAAAGLELCWWTSQDYLSSSVRSS